MSDEVIEIQAKPRDSKEILMKIGGTVYEFRVPKLYGLISTIKSIQKSDNSGGMRDVAMFDKIEDWLFASMKDSDAENLKSRLLDESDDVDIDTLVQAFQHLIKIASDRPSG